MARRILCGVEEPLRQNFQLLAVGEDGVPELATFSVSGLNRYSLVWRESRALTAEEAEPLLQPVLQRHGTGLEVVGWHARPVGWGPGRIRVVRRRLANSGWSVKDVGESVVASRTLRFASEWEASMESAPWSSFCLFGVREATEALTVETIQKTLGYYCRFGRLYPSKLWLSWLKEADVSVAYRVHEAGDPFGVVVVTPMTLGCLVGELFQHGKVDKVEYGELAGEVWRLQS